VLESAQWSSATHDDRPTQPVLPVQCHRRGPAGQEVRRRGHRNSSSATATPCASTARSASAHRAGRRRDSGEAPTTDHGVGARGARLHRRHTRSSPTTSTLAGHVTLGDWVIIGGLSGVHQFCRVGSARDGGRRLGGPARHPAVRDLQRQSVRAARRQHRRVPLKRRRLRRHTHQPAAPRLQGRVSRRQDGGRGGNGPRRADRPAGACLPCISRSRCCGLRCAIARGIIRCMGRTVQPRLRRRRGRRATCWRPCHCPELKRPRSRARGWPAWGGDRMIAAASTRGARARLSSARLRRGDPSPAAAAAPLRGDHAAPITD